MSPPVLDAHGLAMPEISRPVPAMLPELATRAMQRFSCLGSACEDTCCRDFGISIDRGSLERLRVAVAKDPVRQEKLVHLVVLGLPREGTPSHNLVQLDEHGACPLLESSGVCGVHRDYGEELLSTSCSVFPRTALAVGAESLEVTGSLACPEVARLTLLADDGLIQDAPAGPILPRSYVGQVLDLDPTDLYASSFPDVRGALLRLFERGAYPIGSRLAFAANLAAQVDGFFRRERRFATQAERLMMKRRLKMELDVATAPDTLRALHGDLQALAGGSPAVVAAALAMLVDRRRLTHAPRFGELVERALSRLNARAVEAGDATAPILPVHLSDADRRSRAAVDRHAPGVMDEILGRYCRHYLLRNPFTSSGSLLSYLGRLSLSLAAIRILWTASVELAEAPTAPSSAAGYVREVAITVIQGFSKAISHHADFLDAVHAASDQAGGMTFGRLVLFAKAL